MADDPNLLVLHDIYKAIQGTNRRLEQSIEETNIRFERLDGRLDEMIRRQTESEMRIATELISIAQLLRDKLEDHERVVDHERRITLLEAIAV